MNDLAMAGPLQAALAEKGYATLTPVQEAVLKEGVAGRDLLVSAQTGSGKTVAFGVAIAPEVLGGVDRLMPADKPLALVVAPTRELAQQVNREFEWLYAQTGVQLATCVGGMDYRTERRALDRGAHIVVGTPGRLRDHIERGSLDLSGARAVVLDEADEMLDLGFSEDLEFILGSAPEDRRTLMFSATVPKEIEKLARTFQRDALRVVVAGEARQHADIAYEALSVQARDKEHAIFNVLRFHESPAAIVFCKTRANVNHLFARMINRGFQAVALSGELSQQERMHALQALRDGRARVCIATDVAARGIDLPGLELVIHADLPSNSEVLLHRSGRTGRAGQKGTSVLVVPPAEARKAQRLLQGAKVEANWGKAPSAEDVQGREDQRVVEHPALAEAPGEEAEMATVLLDRWGPDNVAAAFIRLWRQGRSAPEELSDSLPPPAALPPRDRNEFGPSVWYRISVGHTGRAEARWLLPKICDAGGIAKDGIGAIRVQQEETFVQIAAVHEARFGQSLEIDQGLSMEKMAGEPDLGRPAPRPAPRREDKAPYQPKPPRIVEDDAAPAEAVRKPYARKDDAERKPYAPRATAERKPYAPREDGPRKPYAPKGDGERKPYAAKTGAEKAGAERKPYVRRDDAAPRAEGVKKPRWTPDDRAGKGASRDEGKPAYKSSGFKSQGGSDSRPARAAGYKSHGAEGKPAPRGEAGEGRKPWAGKGEDARPYAKREGTADKRGPKPEGSRSWGTKPAAEGDKKPYAAKGAKPFARKPGAKPAAPKTDARDTSKRFVPPKKPKG
ncbi:MAG: DEAD/DEAH box helicase [Rhodobacter sp.]|nr:DEAD/DEAH box helicase [Rhodobacter sp.]